MLLTKIEHLFVEPEDPNTQAVTSHLSEGNLQQLSHIFLSTWRTFHAQHIIYINKHTSYGPQQSGVNGCPVTILTHHPLSSRHLCDP